MSGFSWDEYAALQDQFERLLRQLFVESEDAEAYSTYAISLADTALDSIKDSVQDLNSELAGVQVQANLLFSQSIPMTGGSYTRLILESFKDKNIVDEVSDFSKQPLILNSQNTNTGCPVRPSLVVDPSTQTLQVQSEGIVSAFSGLPGSGGDIGGTIEVDKIYGTPMKPSTGDTESSWLFAIGAEQAISPQVLPPWIPSNYSGGATVRLHIYLQNPVPVTQVRLRGTTSSAYPGCESTQVLETVIAADSHPTPGAWQTVPVRAVNSNGNFSSGISSWTVVGSSGFTIAPGRSTYSPSGTYASGSALMLEGVVKSAPITLYNNVYVLRYQAFCPFSVPSGANVPWLSQAPVPPKATHVCVYYYDTYGNTLYIDVFRDSYPISGDVYAGAAQITHLLKVPQGAVTCVITAGTDPVSKGVIAYSDIWLCDEAIVTPQNSFIPTPTESSLQGPSIPGGVSTHIDESSVDNLLLPVGNLSGNLSITDVWVTLGQSNPYIESSASWKLALQKETREEQYEPYALSLPKDLSLGLSSRDPLPLHQARYIGTGATEKVSKERLHGFSGLKKFRPRLTSLLGLWRAAISLGAKDPDVLDSYWKHTTGLAPDVTLPDSLTLSSWPNLWSAVISLTKSKTLPVSRVIWILASATTQDILSTNDSLYIYPIGLSSFELLRQEYAQGGLYVTLPLQEIDGTGTITGEIHEVGIATDPPVETLGNVRLWIIPDSQALQGGVKDSPASLLARAIPLDSKYPRATFHSAAETSPGVVPAISDIANTWGMNQPAFTVQPSFNTESIYSITPDESLSGYQLEHIPYINQEAIYRVSSALSSGSSFNPTEYDPNALNPIVDFIPSGDPGYSSSLFPSGSGGLYRVSGYRPVAITITLPDGRQIVPDSLGAPKVGEIQYQGNEILQAATDTLTGSTVSTGYSIYSPTKIVSYQSYSTAYSPIAAGENGTSIQLYWHKSLDFDPQQGGVINTYDVLIPPSAYEIDAITGQIRLYSQPPGGWADYDQVLANYYWRVSSISAVQYFPYPGIDALYEAYTPYEFGSSGTIANTMPASSVLTGTTYLGGLLSPNYFSEYENVPGKSNTGSQFARLDPGEQALGYWQADSNADSPSSWGSVGKVQINQPEVLTTNSASLIPYINENGVNQSHLGTVDGFDTDVEYKGPGTYHLSAWTARMDILGGMNYGGSYGPNCDINTRVDIIIYEEGVADINTSTLGTQGIIWQLSQVGQPVVIYSAPWGTGNGLITLNNQNPSAGNTAFYQFPNTAGESATYPNGPCGKYGASVGNPTAPLGWCVVPDSTYLGGFRCDIPISVPTVNPITQAQRYMRVFVYSGQSVWPTGVGSAAQVGTGSNVWNSNLIGTLLGSVQITADLDVYQNIGCPSGYSASGGGWQYDSLLKACVYYPPSGSGTVTTGSDSGNLTIAPSDVPDLNQLTNQVYPVTRNVTNYSDTTQPTLNQYNPIPGPGYYPVFEYLIQPGGKLLFAEDFSSMGPFPGSQIQVKYLYLDISPRIALEVLPPGQNIFSLPGTSISNVYSAPRTQTPEINSIGIMVNVSE